jgi:hypothetical protein
MHPAKDGFAALPFFDEFDLSTVDVLLLSQYVVTPLSSRSDRILSSFEKRMSKRVSFVAATSAAVNDSEGILPPTSNTQTWFMYIRKSMQIFDPLPISQPRTNRIPSSPTMVASICFVAFPVYFLSIPTCVEVCG